LVEVDQLCTSIPQLEEGVAARRAIGVAVAKLFELALLAEAYGAAGRNDEGLQVVAEALEFADRTGEGFYLPEIHRLKGELLLRQGEPGAVFEAVACFRRALDIARRQQARALELRGATSLARLWLERGERQQALELLAPVYNWFTEGFDTPDLKNAKATLEALM
jgi:predicted ATPase